jgi:uncharacterized protein YjgD (DUF1641 family)
MSMDSSDITLDAPRRQSAERALATLVENGDLDRLVTLARTLGAAGDALSDDIVARLAETAGNGLDLLDRATRANIAGALPAIAALVETGDLERLVGLARIAGGVGDALSDDIVSRVAETAGNALVLIDRVTRSGLADRLVALADAAESSRLIDHLLTAMTAAAAETSKAPPPQGGIGGLWHLLKQPQTQSALTYVISVVNHFRAAQENGRT